MAVTAGDLNGDGLAAIVGIDQPSVSFRVWLAKADGTNSSATSSAYGTSGTQVKASPSATT